MQVEFLCWNCKRDNLYEHTEGETILMKFEAGKEHATKRAVRVSLYCANCDLENKVGLGALL